MSVRKHKAHSTSQAQGQPSDGNSALKIENAGMVLYAFFGVHMLMFGLSGFFMAYGSSSPDLFFLYMHGGIAIFVYMMFYTTIFGREQVKWMLINAALGLFGIYAQIGWILERFDKRIADYSWATHVVPFLYYVLYTFLLRQFLIDVTRSRKNPQRRALVDAAYVVVSVIAYGLLLWSQRRGG